MSQNTPRTLVIGTGNKHKVQEIVPLLSGLNLVLKAATDYGPFAPVEHGLTLEANAMIKANAALELSGEWSISDDTGLEVDALGGRPGIYAARYAGEGCTFADNIRKMLGELAGVPVEKRAARFACVIAFCRPGYEPQTFRGECLGNIALAPVGEGGFGYDPIFIETSLQKTFAQMTAEEKNRISHRSIAVKKCKDFLVNIQK